MTTPEERTHPSVTTATAEPRSHPRPGQRTSHRTEVAVIGGGLGGVAAALAAARAGRRVVLTEEYRWLGGQLTSQAVPPDEHPWIEQFGCTRSYRQLREGIRQHYRSWYPLSEHARHDPELNPGLGRVSKLCHEPRVALAVIEAMLQPWRTRGTLVVLHGRPVAAEVEADVVRGVTLQAEDGTRTEIEADYFLDATENGDLLPLTGTEHVTGFESRAETGEPHAPEQAQPDNVQAASVCFVLEHRAGEDHTIDRPAEYDYWARYEPPSWTGRLLSWTAPDPRTLQPFTRTFEPNPEREDTSRADQSRDAGDKELWRFRRIAARASFRPGTLVSDITLVNWPMIDYLDGRLYHDTDPGQAAHHLARAKGLSRSMLYWMQTEAPRVDGGTGFPGLRLRGDLLGTEDGLAMAPYIREARRIRALYTVTEADVSSDIRGDRGAVGYPDSVGVGSYRIDLHPSTGGDGYIDIANSPFEIPLRALVPQRVRNLLAAGKCLGTTHITNGCFRLHPVEWNIGESAAVLAVHCLEHGREPHQVAADDHALAGYQTDLHTAGVETRWPRIGPY